MLTRRFFVQLLASSVGASPLLVPAGNSPTPEEEKLIGVLPEPPHPAIPIAHPLLVSFDRATWGRAECANWELNERGIFCNKDPISFSSTPLTQGRYGEFEFAHKIYFQDRRHFWMMTVLPLKEPRRITRDTRVLWEPGELRITPDLMKKTEGRPLSTQDAFPGLSKRFENNPFRPGAAKVSKPE